MRIISQNGLLDVPYELIAFSPYSGNMATIVGTFLGNDLGCGGCHCDDVHGARFAGTLFFPRVVRHFAGGLYRGYVFGTSY